MPGRYKIRSFAIPEHLIVTLFLERTSNPKAAKDTFYTIEVLYRPRPGAESFDYIKLEELPTSLCYMVYFIRQHLIV